MANLREAFDYASKNPNSDFARNLDTLARSGALDIEAKKYGIDLSPFQQKQVEQKTGMEKVANITGGEEIARGLGQAMAQPKTSRQLEQAQTQATDIQGQLLTRLKEKKARGEDTSRIESALTDLGINISQIGSQTEQLLNPEQLTNKQVIGDAVQLGTTLGTVGGLSGAGTSRTLLGRNVPGLTTQAPGIAQNLANKVVSGTGVLRGAGQGAIAGAGQGIVSGGLMGTAQGIQDDLSAGEIARQGVRGAITGGVTGGVLGSVVGGISGGINKSKDSFLKNITPDVEQLGSKEYQKLITQNRIQPKTATNKAQYILSQDEIDTATKYRNLINKDPVKTTTNIGGELAKQDSEVEKFLQTNNGIFNKGELKNYISRNIEDISDVTIDDKQFSKAKTKLINNFLTKLQKNDMESLWKGRKQFDSAIDKAFGSSSTSSQIKVAFRNAVQDFISERTPDKIYSNKMSEMTKLYRLRDNVLRKAIAEKGQSSIRKWIQENPLKAQAIGWTGGTVLLDKLID